MDFLKTKFSIKVLVGAASTLLAAGGAVGAMKFHSSQVDDQVAAHEQRIHTLESDRQDEREERAEQRTDLKWIKEAVERIETKLDRR